MKPHFLPKSLHTIFFSCLLLAGMNLQAQRTCGTLSLQDHIDQNNHDAVQKILETKKFIEEKIRNGQVSRGDIYTIPVVVHVVYNTPDQNISDAQVISQIDVLNEDFRRMNADAMNTPAPFLSVASDVEIEFCLAAVDPNGDATDGITRTMTASTSFSGNGDIKYTAMGGKDGWPYQDYMNIWVGPLSGGLLGYAASVDGGAPAAEDGVVMGSEYTGRVGTVTAPFDLGRTATHEVGHWLGLNHVWGAGGCAADDGISDTPLQDGPNFGCPTFPSISCSNGPNGDMFQNYMDYSDDACFNLFTNGQSLIMRAMFEPGGPKESLLTSNVCLGLAFDAGMEQVIFPTDEACGGDFSIELTLKNFGEKELTSALINYELNGSLIANYNWLGSLLQGESELIDFPVLNLPPGMHTITAYTDVSGVGFDSDLANDTLEFTFEVLNTNGIPISYQEGFENGIFPPSDWKLNNPDSDIGWERNNQVSRTGVASIFLNNAEYNSIGEMDEFTLPGLDLTPYNKAGLSFYLSHAQYGPNSGFSDTLEIWASIDCGKTFSRIYKKFGIDLATAAPTTESFVPSGPSDWRQEWVDLTDYDDQTFLILKFRNITNYENNLYIDNINITKIFALSLEDDLNSGKLQLFPNPATDQVNLVYETDAFKEVRVNMMDATGRIVLSEVKEFQPGKSIQTLPISQLASGIYLVQLQQGDDIITKKLTVH